MSALVTRLRQVVNSPRPEVPTGDNREERIRLSGFFDPADIGWVCENFFSEGSAPGTTWDRVLRDAHMTLPGWFRHGLDPLGEDYAAQQHRLWQLIAGIDRPYEADVDEKEHSWGDIDAVRSPGFFVRRDPLAVTSASDHFIAMGMLLKHSGLRPGDRALEYGAGFGQTALAMARLGVHVDTVDISATFCDYVRLQAEFFQVPLTPFRGRFGMQPRPGQKYRLVWFYESFHHCLDFRSVVGQLHGLVEADGRVILGGEPMVEREYAAVPYPWGVRLHSEVVAVVRRQGWFELGFSEDFLFELFVNAGFDAQRIVCEPSLFGRLYIFRPRGEVVSIESLWLPPVLAERWHDAEAGGRWTRGDAALPVDASDRFASVRIEVENRLGRRQSVSFRYGSQTQTLELAPGSQGRAVFTAEAGARRVDLSCRPQQARWRDRLRRRDRRALGIFVQRLGYTA